MELHEQIETVTDARSFLAFVRTLRLDRVTSVAAAANAGASAVGPDAGGWKNTSIESFLEAAIAWADDTDFGVNQGLTAEDPWKRFAVFLYCGKIYE